jgi:hypothetical protein
VIVKAYLETGSSVDIRRFRLTDPTYGALLSRLEATVAPAAVVSMVTRGMCRTLSLTPHRLSIRRHAAR